MFEKYLILNFIIFYYHYYLQPRKHVSHPSSPLPPKNVPGKKTDLLIFEFLDKFTGNGTGMV